MEVCFPIASVVNFWQSWVLYFFLLFVHKLIPIAAGLHISLKKKLILKLFYDTLCM